MLEIAGFRRHSSTLEGDFRHNPLQAFRCGSIWKQFGGPIEICGAGKDFYGVR